MVIKNCILCNLCCELLQARNLNGQALPEKVKLCQNTTGF